MKVKLKVSDVKKRMKHLPEWALNAGGTQLSRSFYFPSFVSALSFVAKIAVHAEVLNHHPDIELSYGKVKLKISTHEVKGLTSADFELAGRVDSLSEKK